MLPTNPWKYLNAAKALYAKYLFPICGRYQLDRMELDILLFLANNPHYDTAGDIVQMLRQVRSYVSGSVKRLENRGYLCREFSSDNKKTAHLKLCPCADEVVRDGQIAQEQFLSALVDGFSEEDLAMLRQFNQRITHNISAHLGSAALPLERAGQRGAVSK